MSDGGKGSAPRPYSVTQDQFANNWDAIFGKKKSKESVAKPSCYCYNCNKDHYKLGLTHMIVCPKCGNKRCPQATDHNLNCSNSNDPNQAGSRY